MTPLDMVLNRDAILDQLAFATAFQEQLETVRRGCTILPDLPSSKKLTSILEDETKPPEKKTISKGKKFRKKREHSEIIDFLIEATLDEIDVRLELGQRPLAELSVKKGRVEMSKRKSYTKVDCTLRHVLILDLYSSSLYKKV